MISAKSAFTKAVNIVSASCDWATGDKALEKRGLSRNKDYNFAILEGSTGGMVGVLAGPVVARFAGGGFLGVAFGTAAGLAITFVPSALRAGGIILKDKVNRNRDSSPRF